MPRKKASKTKAGNKIKSKPKTNRSVEKRFTITATGKLKRSKSNRVHNVKEQKSSKRVRGLRKATLVSKTMQDNYKKVLPYL